MSWFLRFVRCLCFSFRDLGGWLFAQVFEGCFCYCFLAGVLFKAVECLLLYFASGFLWLFVLQVIEGCWLFLFKCLRGYLSLEFEGYVVFFSSV